MRAFLFSFLLLLGGAAGAQNSYRVAGTVVDGANGAPLAKCRVALRRDDAAAAQNSIQTATTLTDSDGRFVFENVVPGKFALVARRSGYRAQALDEHYGFASAVAVGPGKDSEHIVFRLAPSASIVGRLQDEFGDPVSEAQVMLFRRSTETGRAKIVSRSISNSNRGGYFHFYDLPSGEYLIAVIARPWYSQYLQPDLSQDEHPPLREQGEADLNLTFPITYYPSATDSASASSIKVLPGDQFVADMQLATQPATVLKIPLPAVDDNTSNRRQVSHDLQASIFGTPMSLYPMVSSMNYGNVSLTTGIPAGTYILNETDTPADGNSGQASATRRQMKVSDGTVEYKKNVPGIAVSGTVELQGISRVPDNLFMRFEKMNGEAVDVRIDPKGQFQPFHLFPGIYQYFTLNQQTAIKTLLATNAKVVGRTIEVGTNPINLKITLGNVVTKINGTVLTADSKPLSGAMVVLVPEDIEHNLNLMRRDQSDMDGTFTLRVVMPGKYRLLALQDAWDLEWSNPKVLERFYGAALPIEVVAGENVKDVEVKAQRTKE